MSAMQLKVSESRWTMPLVSLAVVGMLVLFYTVVSGAVKAAELRRQTMAAQSSAILQCHALPSGSDSKACEKGLGPKVSAEEPALFAAK
jgi:hypothetical protein